MALANPLPDEQLFVEVGDKEPGRLHQHRVAHGRNRSHAAFEEPAGHGSAGVGHGLRCLAGFEEEERDAMLANNARDLIRVDELAAASFEFRYVRRVFKAKCAQAVFAVVNTVAVEVDHMVWFAGMGGAQQFGFESRECRGIEERKPGQIAQLRQRVDKRLGADAVIDVRGILVLRARTDHQHADRGLGRNRRLLAAVGQAAPDANRPRALEKIALVVVDEIPRQ
jgi:hypothetical protein